ncbi:MAG: BT_3928 family protein [Bacteroidia bacterium]
MRALTLISRVLVGLLFIISGLIKANDPLGFSYKLDEYFEVFGMSFLTPASLAMAMGICVVEIGLGVALIMGVYMNFTAWLLLLMIIFFTVLTGYSAVTGKVTDCGCFGDAIKLTPWESFFKDLVLLVLIGIIFIRRNYIEPLVSRLAGRTFTIAAYVLAFGFTLFTYLYLPVKDFRPYAIGKSIPEQMAVPDDAPQPVYETKLIYKNKSTGELREMSMDEYTASNIWEDENWEWADTQNKLIKEGFIPKIANFIVVDEDGTEIHDDLANNPEYNFILVAYDLSNTNKDVQSKINELALKAQQNGYDFVGLTATSVKQTNEFRHEVQAMYPYYFADATFLKTIIRSNPGLLLVKGGTVVDKWPWRSIPTYERIEEKHLKK